MASQIGLTTNLAEGLSGKGERWKERISARVKAISVVGASFLDPAFVSCAGLFTRQYREKLLHKIWDPFLEQNNIKVAKEPLDLLSDSALVP